MPREPPSKGARPQLPLLLTRRRRLAVNGELTPAGDRRHFTHLAELARLRLVSLERLKAELVKLNVVGPQNDLESAIFEAEKLSHKRPEIVAVLERHDRAFMDTLFNVSRIGSKRRQRALQVFDRVQAATTSKQFESSTVFGDFIAELERERTLDRNELAHLRTAFHDWVTARQLFYKSLFSH